MDKVKREIISTDEFQSNRSPYNKNVSFNDTFSLPNRFAGLSKVILRNLNGSGAAPTFSLYTKDKITEFLKNPYRNEKNIRNAITYIYGASSHFMRLIQYFVGLSDLAYVVSPYKIDTATVKPQTVKKNYKKVLDLLASMDIKNQFSKILTVCLREDVFYGTMWVNTDSIIVQQLPSDYCTIAIIEDNVPNVSFDFAYFDTNAKLLDNFPDEFRTKYALYQKDRTGMQWQELEAPTSFAVKCNKDILNYALPPFAGILREIYDLEDYKQLRLTKSELENYAMLVMKLGMNNNGEWDMDYDKAKEFWYNLDSVLPEEIGSVLSPMDITKINFERSNAGETSAVSEAEQSLFSAAGVSSLLFNNDKASSNALLLSIKADQAITYGIVKSIEAVLNRYIHRQSYGKLFKVTFLDCSPYNRKETGDAYLKACQLGVPMVSYYCASQGLAQDEMDCMNFLEDEVLRIKTRFIPLKSSATQAASSGEAGRSEKDIGELSDSGEISREGE